MINAGLRFFKSRCLFVLLCLGCVGWAQAEIYKSIDAEGHVTYSSTPSKGAKKLGFEPLVPPAHTSRSHPPHPARARDNTTPSDFPRVDGRTQKSRDSLRYKILADELAAEQKLLAEARANLKQADASRAEGKSRTLREEVTLHENNVSALNTELSHLK